MTASILLTYLLQTASLIGLPDVQSVNHEEIHCLAENVYFESRGENIRGQYAVAHVTLNRVNNGDYPDTVCKVVRQKSVVRSTGKRVCAFSWVCEPRRTIKFVGRDGTINDYAVEQYNTALVVALKVLYGDVEDVTKGATSFHNTSIPTPSWAQRMLRTVKIGNHVFYRPVHRQN